MFNDTESLEQQVRDITDELNTTDITSALILRCMTRAQQDMVRTLTRKYAPNYMQEVILTAADFTQVDSTNVARIATLPALNFGYCVNQVSAKLGNGWLPVQQRSFWSNQTLDTSTNTGMPISYSIMGNKIYVYPGMSTSAQLRIRFQYRPLPFVATACRVVGYDLDAGTLQVYSPKPISLSTDVDSLEGFINVVDPITGIVKGTFQLSGVDVDNDETLDSDNNYANPSTGSLTIKLTGLDRETVFGLTVAANLPDTIALDDLVCVASGTCIPYMAVDLTNYLVEMTSFFVKRAVHQVEESDYQERDRIIDEISKMWSGRENSTQIRKHRSASNWSPQWFFRGAN